MYLYIPNPCLNLLYNRIIISSFHVVLWKAYAILHHWKHFDLVFVPLDIFKVLNSVERSPSSKIIEIKTEANHLLEWDAFFPYSRKCNIIFNVKNIISITTFSVYSLKCICSNYFNILKSEVTEFIWKFCIFIVCFVDRNN